MSTLRATGQGPRFRRQRSAASPDRRVRASDRRAAVRRDSHPDVRARALDRADAPSAPKHCWCRDRMIRFGCRYQVGSQADGRDTGSGDDRGHGGNRSLASFALLVLLGELASDHGRVGRCGADREPLVDLLLVHVVVRVRLLARVMLFEPP